MAKEELCALKVFKETWRMLRDAADLEDARKLFKKMVLRLILEEE